MKGTVADYHYKVFCARVEPVSGAHVQLTAYPRDLTMSNAEVYLAGSGFEFTGFSTSSDFSPSAIDLEGIAGVAGIDRDLVAAGYFDNARLKIFATEWNNPVEDQEEIALFILGKTHLLDERYKIESMSLIDALNQSTGKTYTPGCTKTFGGQEFAGCKVALGPITVTGTLTHMTSQTVFRDSSRAEAADYFGYGQISFTTGDNAGMPAKDIKRYEADGTIEVFEAFHYPVQVGDQYSMIPGCRKRLDEDCITKWSNVDNYGGYPFVPVTSIHNKAGID